MYQYVDRALHAFDYPSEASLFPYKVCHPKVKCSQHSGTYIVSKLIIVCEQKYFSPPLKQDLVIEFCVHDVFIACNAYALDYAFSKHNIKPENQNSVV